MTAIKLTTGILATAMMVGGIVATSMAQNPDAIDNARSIAKSLQQKQANDTNAALDAAGVPAAAKPAPAKPAPGAPAPAVKPATIPGAKSAPAAPAPAPKAKAVSAPQAASAQGSHNQLQNVNVVQGSDSIQIEINSSEAVTPRVSKLKSPARVVVELPETVVASSKSKIPVGSDGVKGVRIGMDGKTPPTTSVVVDLEKPLAYDLSGSGEKLVLTLHAQAGEPTSARVETKPAAKTVAKNAAAAEKADAPAKPKAVAAAKTHAPAAKPAVSKAVVAAKETPKQPAEKQQAAKETKPAVPAESAPVAADASKIGDNPKQPKAEDKKWAMNGKRDPFFSPVVQQQNGSGCSTGKKCLEIGNINLRGVVKSDSGFIAVVTNNLNKAYFLRENDPVFNGYVVRITGDSVVFQETVQDKLGKPLTREVVKRIFTPAV